MAEITHLGSGEKNAQNRVKNEMKNDESVLEFRSDLQFLLASWPCGGVPTGGHVCCGGFGGNGGNGGWWLVV